MRKKSKYRPRDVNPQAHLMAVKGVFKFDEASKKAEMQGIHDAVRAVATQTCEVKDWVALQHAVNMIEQLVIDKVLQDNAAWLTAVQDTVQRLVTERRACRYDELATIREIPEYYAVVVDNLTYAQYENTKVALVKRKLNAYRGQDNLWILPTQAGA